MEHYNAMWAESLPLVVHGSQGLNKEEHRVTEPLQMIGFTYDADRVCNVILGFPNERVETLSEDPNGACDSNNAETVMLQVDEDYPLVGFHGRRSGSSLVSLGAIFLDAKNNKCLERLSVAEQ